MIDSNSAAIKPSNGGRKRKINQKYDHSDWFPGTSDNGDMGDYFASGGFGSSGEEGVDVGYGSGGFGGCGYYGGNSNSISANNILTTSTVQNSPPRKNKGKKSIIPLPQSKKNTQPSLPKRKGSIYASTKEVIQEMPLTRKNNAHAFKVLGMEVSQLNLIQQQCKKYIEGAAQNATDEDTFDEFGLLWNNETGKEMENRLG